MLQLNGSGITDKDFFVNLLFCYTPLPSHGIG